MMVLMQIFILILLPTIAYAHGLEVYFHIVFWPLLDLLWLIVGVVIINLGLKINTLLAKIYSVAYMIIIISVSIYNFKISYIENLKLLIVLNTALPFFLIIIFTLTTRNQRRIP